MLFTNFPESSAFGSVKHDAAQSPAASDMLSEAEDSPFQAKAKPKPKTSVVALRTFDSAAADTQPHLEPCCTFRTDVQKTPIREAGEPGTLVSSSLRDDDELFSSAEGTQETRASSLFQRDSFREQEGGG